MGPNEANRCAGTGHPGQGTTPAASNGPGAHAADHEPGGPVAHTDEVSEPGRPWPAAWIDLGGEG